MKIAVEIIGNEHLRVRGRSVVRRLSGSVAQWLGNWVIQWLSDATFERIAAVVPSCEICDYGLERIETC